MVTSETAPPSAQEQHVLLRRLKRVTIGVTDELEAPSYPKRRRPPLARRYAYRRPAEAEWLAKRTTSARHIHRMGLG